MIEAMKQALEAIDIELSASTSEELELASEKLCDARESLRQAIREHAMYEVQRLGQEIEQEPVCPDCKAKVLYECVACSSNNYPPQRTEQNFCPRCGKRTNDIHTCTPPQRTWAGLTDEDFENAFQETYIMGDSDLQDFAKVIEAKLKERNNA